MLPPPSREATPQVVTSDPSSQPAATGRAAIEYPDTGYPSLSPERHRSAPDTAGYATGQYDRPGSATQSQPAELGNATVGPTQRGFYGEQYQSTGPARGADHDPGTSNEYPSTGARDYDHLTGAGSESVGGDRWADPATAGDLSATGAADNPPSSSAYDQVRQGIRDDWQNTTQAVSRAPSNLRRARRISGGGQGDRCKRVWTTSGTDCVTSTSSSRKVPPRRSPIPNRIRWTATGITRRGNPRPREWTSAAVRTCPRPARPCRHRPRKDPQGMAAQPA